MINGSHVIIYSRDPSADRTFCREVLGLPHVEAGEGWLKFGLPAAEVAFHPADENDRHEFYFLTKTIDDFVEKMRALGVETSPVEDRGWGLITLLTLPGGGRLGVYEPRHARPAALS